MKKIVWHENHNKDRFPRLKVGYKEFLWNLFKDYKQSVMFSKVTVSLVHCLK